MVHGMSAISGSGSSEPTGLGHGHTGGGQNDLPSDIGFLISVGHRCHSAQSGFDGPDLACNRMLRLAACLSRV
jgi:hypothetical protein